MENKNKNDDDHSSLSSAKGRYWEHLVKNKYPEPCEHIHNEIIRAHNEHKNRLDFLAQKLEECHRNMDGRSFSRKSKRNSKKRNSKKKFKRNSKRKSD